MQSTSLYQPFLHRAYKRVSNIPNNKRTASYFTLTLSLLSLSFFGLFAIRPTIITAITLLKSVEELRKLNTQYENKIASIIRAQQEFDQIKNDTVLLNFALPANAQFSKLAKTIEKYALQENFTITQLQIDNSPVSTLPSSNKVQNLGFYVVGSGSYSSISAFISHVLNWKRVININSMDFITESAPGGTIKLTMKATTYYEP